MTTFPHSVRSSEAPHHQRHSSLFGSERSSSLRDRRDSEPPSHQRRSRTGRTNTATGEHSKDHFSRLAATGDFSRRNDPFFSGEAPGDLHRSNAISCRSRSNASSAGRGTHNCVIRADCSTGASPADLTRSNSSSTRSNFNSAVHDSLSDYFLALMDRTRRSQTDSTAPSSSRNSSSNQIPHTNSDAASSRSLNAGQPTSSCWVPCRSQSQREGNSDARQLASCCYVPYRSQSQREGRSNMNTTLSDLGSNHDGGPKRWCGTGLVCTGGMNNVPVGRVYCNGGRWRVHEDWRVDPEDDSDSDSVSDREEQLRRASDTVERAEAELQHYREKRPGCG